MGGQCQASITLSAVVLKLPVLRMRDFGLSVSLCLAVVAAMLSACLLLPLIDHSPRTDPLLSTPQRRFGKAEKWISHVRVLRYREGCDLVTPRGDLPDQNIILSPSPTENKKQILSFTSAAQWQERRKSPLSRWSFDNHLSTWPVISPTGSAWHLRWRGEREQVVHPSLRLPLSSLLSISPVPLLCVHNLISKQGVDSHYGNPGKWPGHYPPPPSDIWDLHLESSAPSLSLPPLSNLSVCSGEPTMRRWLSLSTGYNEIGPPGWLYSNRQPISIT